MQDRKACFQVLYSFSTTAVVKSRKAMLSIYTSVCLINMQFTHISPIHTLKLLRSLIINKTNSLPYTLSIISQIIILILIILNDLIMYEEKLMKAFHHLHKLEEE